MLWVQVLLFFKDYNFEFKAYFHLVDLILLNVLAIVNGHSVITWMINDFLQAGLQGGLKTILWPSDVPPSPLLDSKEPNYVKGGSRWDLVPLPTFSTKGGERGVLEVPGLD
jgi:hypothetical protein